MWAVIRWRRSPPRSRSVARARGSSSGCERVAREKRAAFRDEEYWGRPVPGFGDPEGRLVIVGLAPAAHGANRTGRMFTGDRSGDFLYAALYRRGYANQPHARSLDDGLTLRDVYIAAPVKCAPPQNKPTPAERDTCAPYLARELALLTRARVPGARPVRLPGARPHARPTLAPALRSRGRGRVARRPRASLLLPREPAETRSRGD